MCTSDAGTIASFGPIIGQSNDGFTLPFPDTIYLCMGDSILINHAGDEDLSGDPNMATPAGIGYAFFDCQPTTTGPDTAAIKNDPCILNDFNPTYGFYVYTGGNLSGDVPFFNDGNLQTFFNAGNPDIIYFAPITFDALFAGQNAEYEGNPVGECVSLSPDQAFAVAYLNEITITELALTGCQGSFRVSGGLSELDNSDYPTINVFREDDPTVTGTVIGGPYDHDDIVSFTVPGPGTYVIEVEDGKSCGGSAMTPEILVCDAVVFDLPLTNMLPSTNNCVPVTVANFIDLLSAQFSVSWDPTILSISGVQGFNPNVPDLNASSFSWQNFPVPNMIPPGVMGVSWSDNTFAGVTLPDDAIFFEICFDVIGQLGDCSQLEITESLVPFEVVNINSDQVQLVPGDGKAVITENPFFVLLEQDSLTCPSFDDGSFTVTVDQGVSPYQFSWNTVPNSGPNSAPVVIPNNGGSATVSNLPAGSYQVTITDATVPSQTVVDTVEVISGPVLGITIRDTVPSCFGLSDGSLAFVPTSDGLPIENPGPEYTFQWSVPNGVPNPGNTFFADNLRAGSYGITVTDPAGCQEIALIPLGQPPALRVLDSNTFISDASCTGGEDGEIMITASGGTTADGNYSFAWSNGLMIDASMTTIINLNPGQYCVTVTDDNGCSTEECYTVGAVKVLSLNENITDIVCNGDATGEIFVTGTTTGAPADTPYTFNWSGNASVPTNTPTTSLIENLVAGNYAVTMTDASAAGCQVIDTFTVSEPLALDVQVIDLNNESCVIGDDGSITLGVSGGTGTYTYTWSHDPTLTDSIATGLSAGNYTIDVEDTNGCTAQVTQAISEPDPPTINSLADDSVTCADDTDGTLTVNVTPVPGTNIQSILWSNGMSGPTIMNLSPDQYIVTITADNGCVAIDTALVTAPSPIALDSVQVRRPSCPGFSDGQISIFASGGTAPYAYDWAHVPGGPNNFNPITSLDADDYILVISDLNGCTSETFTVTVEDPPSIVVEFSNIVGTSCPDDNTCDGTATATASYSDGSAGNFVFTWASGEITTNAMTATAVQLCEGTQILTVSNSDGSCPESFEFTVDAPEPITVETVIEPVSCNGLSDGSITLNPSGGTGAYDFFWVETNETTATINGLAAGDYTAIITDDNQCSFSLIVEVNEPAPLTISIDQQATTDDVTCAGDMDGVIAVNTTGGNFTPANPYQYTWDNGAVGSINTNLAAGTYGVTVTDFKGCTDELTFTIGEPDPLVFTLDPIDPPLCFGDPTFISIDTVFGGANNTFEEYTFMIDNNGLSFPVIQPATVFAGDHIVTVEDVNGCTEEVTVSIASPGQITIVLPDVLTVELGDSTTQLLPTITPANNYSYQWNPAEFLSSDTIRNPFVFPERSLEYTLTVVNENGCTATETVFVELDANRNIFIPNIFSPNGDGINDEFAVFGCTGVRNIASARMFDRWGGLLVEETDLFPACLNGTNIWDGTDGGAQDLPTGVYVYMIEIEFLDGVVLTYRGDVTLIR